MTQRPYKVNYQTLPALDSLLMSLCLVRHNSCQSEPADPNAELSGAQTKAEPIYPTPLSECVYC